MRFHFEKRLKLIAFSLLGLMLLLQTPAQAEGSRGWYFSVNPAITSPSFELLTLDMVKVLRTDLTEPVISGQDSQIKMKVGLGVNGEIGYKWRTGIRTGLGIGYRNTEMDQIKSATGSGLIDGQFETTSLMFNLAYDFDNADGIAPYIGVGLGASMHELELTSSNNVAINRSEEDIRFSYELGFGLQKHFNDFVDIGLGYRYLFSNDQSFGFVETEMGVHHLEIVLRVF